MTNHTLMINGVALPDDLEGLAGANFTPTGSDRNDYRLLTAEPGDAAIFSVGFRNNAGLLDILEFDHLAITPVPSGPAYLFFVAGAGIVGGKRKGRGQENRNAEQTRRAANGRNPHS